MPQLSTLFAILLALGAGVSFVVQQAVNADLRVTLNSAIWAGFVSYLGGTVCMLALAIVMREALPFSGVSLRNNWWVWTGGLFGTVYIAISIMLVPRLGTATFVALLVAGQMLASLVFDHYGVFGAPQHSFGLSRLCGALFLIVGVILIRR